MSMQQPIKGPYDFREGPNNNHLSFGDRVGLVTTLGSIPVCGVAWVAQYLVQRQKLSFKQEMLVRAGGHVTKGLNARQLRALVPIQPLRVLLDGHKAKARKAGLHNFNGYFGGETYSARWIHECPDRQPCDPVIIYLHGGGYVLKLADQLVGSIVWFAERYAPARVSILALDYTVTPFEQYPGQLRELCNLYRELSPTCSSISLMGDSCGCHLSLCLLAHSASPVPEVELLNVQIFSLIAFSPWVNLDASADYPSMETCTRDMIDKKSSMHMQSMFCGPSALRNPRINFVLEQDGDYWQKVLPAKTVVTWGANEVLRDSIREWTSNANLKHTFEETPGYHDSLVLGTNLDSTRFVCRYLDEWFGA